MLLTLLPCRADEVALLALLFCCQENLPCHLAVLLVLRCVRYCCCLESLLFFWWPPRLLDRVSAPFQRPCEVRTTEARSVNASKVAVYWSADPRGSIEWGLGTLGRQNIAWSVLHPRLQENIKRNPQLIAHQTRSTPTDQQTKYPRIDTQSQAQELFSEMSRLGIDPTVVTYNSAIAAIGRAGGGQWRQAVALVKQMSATGLAPDNITYNSLIVACGKGGQWKQALSVLKGMKKQGMRCDIVAYSSAISACGEARQWEYSVGK